MDELIIDFISLNYPEQKAAEIVRGFELLELFGVNFYDDFYVNLIMDDNHIDRFDKIDIFINHLKEDLIKVLNEHGILINMNTDFYTVIETVGALYVLQALQDYSVIEPIVYNQTDNQEKFINIVSYISPDIELSLRDNISYVSNDFIAALKEVIMAHEKQTIETDFEHIKTIGVLKMFMANFEPLGFAMYRGKDINEKMTIKDIIALNHQKLLDHFKSTITTSIAKTSIDVLSLLIMAKDSYKAPLEAFKDIYEEYFNQDEYNRIEPVMRKMYTDFLSYLKSYNDVSKVASQFRQGKSL